MHNAPMPRQTLSVLAEQHKAVAALVEDGFRKLGEAKRIIKAALGPSYDYLFPDSIKDYWLDKPDEPRSDMRGSLVKVQENFWAYTLRQTGIRDMMSPEDRERMDKMFRDHTTPDFTEENLLATLQGLYESQDAIFRAAVASCYKRLRPCRWDRQYKTNKPWKVDSKVIIERVFGVCGWIDREELLSELDKVFHFLDGKGFPGYPGDFLTAAKDAARSKKASFETVYFDCRAYHKTGTLHIRFKRLDLLSRFNEIGAGESNALGGK